jgi:uncharacterized cupin superfamily protein
MMKIIIEQLSESEIIEKNIRSWPVWEKEVSRFDWQYKGDEECLFLEGAVTIETPEGKFNLVKGDFVTFKDGLKCIWDVKEPIKKHYRFP